eukprot:scaffold285_cov330-Pavlova_lutheri.AAC.118
MEVNGITPRAAPPSIRSNLLGDGLHRKVWMIHCRFLFRFRALRIISCLRNLCHVEKVPSPIFNLNLLIEMPLHLQENSGNVLLQNLVVLQPSQDQWLQHNGVKPCPSPGHSQHSQLFVNTIYAVVPGCTCWTKRRIEVEKGRPRIAFPGQFGWFACMLHTLVLHRKWMALTILVPIHHCNIRFQALLIGQCCSWPHPTDPRHELLVRREETPLKRFTPS